MQKWVGLGSSTKLTLSSRHVLQGEEDDLPAQTSLHDWGQLSSPHIVT